MNLFQVTKKQEGGGLGLKTFTGNPVTFTPSYSEALPAPFNGTNLKAAVVCGQDLHGYDHPWAGGAGKNLISDYNTTLPITIRGISFSKNTDGSYKIDATAEKNGYPFARIASVNLKAGSYILTPQQYTGLGYRVVNRNVTPAIDYGSYFTLNEDTNDLSVEIAISADILSVGTYNVFIQLEKGSQATAWEPYANICPIVGHSELNLVRCGVNLFNEQFETGGYDNTTGEKVVSGVSTARNITPIIVDSSTAYYFNYPNSFLGDSYSIGIYEYDENMNFLGASFKYVNNFAFTTQATTKYVNFRIYDNGITSLAQFDKCSFNYPSSKTTYEPYNGTPYLVQFGQTVYGGVYDANRGKLTDTFGNDNLADLNWTYSSGDGWFQVYHNVHKFPASGALCSCYPVVYTLGADFVDKSIAVVSNYLAIKDSSFGGDVNALKTALAGQTLCYELATPIEIDVSALSVETIVGVNNIVSDCGGDVTVTCLI